jgi:hypothetical protein
MLLLAKSTLLAAHAILLYIRRPGKLIEDLHSFLPSPQCYSSGWTFASWTVCLHFSLLFIHPSEADFLVSEQFRFYGVRLLAWLPTPNLEDQGSPLHLAPTPWPVWHWWPTSSYTATVIALRVSGALKPHHHGKVETPSVGTCIPISIEKCVIICQFSTILVLLLLNLPFIFAHSFATCRGSWHSKFPTLYPCPVCL